MSSVDDITVDFGYSVGDLKDAPKAKEQLYQAVLKIIGPEPDPKDHPTFAQFDAVRHMWWGQCERAEKFFKEEGL